MAHCSRSNAELPGDIAQSPQALLMVLATDQAFQSAVNGRLFWSRVENFSNFLQSNNSEWTLDNFGWFLPIILQPLISL